MQLSGVGSSSCGSSGGAMRRGLQRHQRQQIRLTASRSRLQAVAQSCSPGQQQQQQAAGAAPVPPRCCRRRRQRRGGQTLLARAAEADAATTEQQQEQQQQEQQHDQQQHEQQQHEQQQQQQQSPPPRAAGRMTYRPDSYAELVGDAARCVLAALEDGVDLMEVEFPAVPTNIDAYKGSSDLFIDSNIQFALSAARQIAATGRRVHILAPDYGEYARSYKIFKSSLEVLDGVSLGHLRETKAGDVLSGLQALLTGGGAPDPAPAGAAADVFIVANVTGVELPALEEYATTVAKGKAVVTWNLELDTLRGDLGLIGYPPKELHYRFLSRVRPVYFLRPRDYSKSVAVAPFIINYSGALFREYPGPWQVMLKQDSGEYACIAEDVVRYNLGEAKEELMAAMGLNTEESGSTMAFLRRGYKTSTWFEDETELEQHKDWRL